MRIAMVASAMLTVMLGLSGCGPGGQAIHVSTVPRDASCEFVRNGQKLGKVEPTPGTLRVDRNSAPIDMDCGKPGHDGAKETLRATSNGSNVAAFIFGGLIGLAANAASGNDNSYPERVSVLLRPQEFADAAERNAFLAQANAQLDAEHKEAAVRIQQNCTVSKELCDIEVKKAAEQRDKLLAELTVKLASVPLRDPVTPAPAAATVDPGARDTQGNPVSFASIAERDQWAEAQRAIAGKRRDEAIQLLRIECGKRQFPSALDVTCGKEIDAVLTTYNQDVARVEKLRSAIPVRPRV